VDELEQGTRAVCEEAVEDAGEYRSADVPGSRGGVERAIHFRAWCTVLGW